MNFGPLNELLDGVEMLLESIEESGRQQKEDAEKIEQAEETVLGRIAELNARVESAINTDNTDEEEIVGDDTLPPNTVVADNVQRQNVND